MLNIKRFETPVNDVIEALKLAGMDWELLTHRPTNPFTGEDIGRIELYRGDNKAFIASHGKDYVPFSNRQHVELLAKFATNHNFEVIGVGEKDNGVFFVQIEIGTHNIGGVSPSRKVITGIFCHNGMMTTLYLPTNVVIVCKNTFALNVSESKNYAQLGRKKGDFLGRAQNAETLLTLEAAQGEQKQLTDTFDIMTRVRMTPAEFKEHVVSKLYKLEAKRGKGIKTIEHLESLFINNDGNQIPEVANTAWNGFMAITNATSHGIETGKEDEALFSSLTPLGTGYQKASAAFEAITDFMRGRNPVGFKSFSF